MLRLMKGWRLTVSTALTFDLSGHCIEGQGIPVDQKRVTNKSFESDDYLDI